MKNIILNYLTSTKGTELIRESMLNANKILFDIKYLK